jgi:AraC-like DNA-binding protein
LNLQKYSFYTQKGIFSMKTYSTTKLTQCFDVTEIMSFFATRFDNTRFHLGRPESYPYWAFIYTVKGDLTFKIGEKLYKIHDGQVLFYPVDLPHTIVSYRERKWEVCFATFTCGSAQMDALADRIFTPDAQLSERIRGLFSFGRSYFHLRGQDETVGGMRCDADEAVLFKIKSEFEGILTELYISPGKKTVARKPPLFGMAVAYMREHMGEPISLSLLAHELCVSVSTLKKVFRKEVGGGVNQYYIDMKLSTAAQLLCDSDLSVGEIAEQLGFSSQFYFSELFKSRYSLSPTAYRKYQAEENARLI